MDSRKNERGSEVLSRLTSRRSLVGLQPALFGDDGPAASGLHELAGPPASGKCSVLSTLCCKCLLPREVEGHAVGGYESGAVLLDLSGKFSVLHLASRLEAMLAAALEPEASADTCALVEKHVRASLARLHVIMCRDTDELLITLHALSENLATSPAVAALFISRVGFCYWADRRRMPSLQALDDLYRRLADTLKGIVCKYGISGFITKLLLFYSKDDRGRPDTSVEHLGKGWSKAMSSSFQCKRRDTLFEIINSKTNKITSFLVQEDGRVVW